MHLQRNLWNEACLIVCIGIKQFAVQMVVKFVYLYIYIFFFGRWFYLIFILIFNFLGSYKKIFLINCSAMLLLRRRSPFPGPSFKTIGKACCPEHGRFYLKKYKKKKIDFLQSFVAQKLRFEKYYSYFRIHHFKYVRNIFIRWDHKNE